MYCFGDNRKGQLGQEEYASSECTETTFNGLAHIDGNSDENEKIFPYPIRVRDSKESDTDDYMSSVRQIAVGADFNCARITQENAQTGPKLKCWGGGNDLSSVVTSKNKTRTSSFNKLRGNSKDTAECYPHVQVPKAITPCNGETTLASITDEELGDMEDVSFVVAGRAHACAVRECTNSASEVLCWGDNSKRQLGRTGTHEDSDRALPVILELGESGSSTHTPLTNVDDSTLSANRDLTCFIKDGEVFCWGQYTSPLGDSVSEIVLPERLSLQCEDRNSAQDTASNFLIK